MTQQTIKHTIAPTTLACALLFILAAAPALASITVTVELKDSSGAALDGATVSYSDGTWKTFGYGTTGCSPNAAGTVAHIFPIDVTGRSGSSGKGRPYTRR